MLFDVDLVNRGYDFKFICVGARPDRIDVGKVSGEKEITEKAIC